MKKYATAMFLFSVILMGCRKEKFTSESEWLGPVLKTELSLVDLLPDSLLKIKGDNSVELVFNYSYGINSLEDILVVPDRVETIEVSLESLVLDDRTFTDTLTLLEMYPQSALLHGQSASLPAQDITTNQGTVVDVTEQFFKTAKFIEGYIDIKISNDLPVEAELIEFQLLNDDDKSVILTGSITNLQPFSSDSQTYSLAGKTVDGVMEMRVSRIKTKASNGQVQVDIYKGLRTTFSVRDLKPEYATAIFPAQNLVEREDETKYEFGGAELTKIEVNTGSILMKVESSIEEAIILEYTVPNSNKTGDTSSIYKEWVIPPAEPGKVVYVEERFPIDGFNIFLKGEDENTYPTFNHIFNRLVARINYTGIERTLSLSDKIKIEFGLIDVKPRLIIGDPGYHQFNIKDTFSIDLFNKVKGNLSLEDARFLLNIENGFGIDALIEVPELIGINTRKPQNVKLTSSEISEPIFIKKARNFGYLLPSEKVIVMDKTNSNLKLFLENLPNEIQPNLKVILRPYGTLDQGDFAFDISTLIADFNLQVPLNFGLDSFELVKDEDFTLFDNEKAQNAVSGKIIVQAVNSFPISCSFQLDFLDDDGTLLTTLFNDKNNNLDAAEVDPISGKVSKGVESEISTSVSETQMASLKNASKIRIISKLNTKDASRYKMYDDYSVGIKIITDLVYDGTF